MPGYAVLSTPWWIPIIYVVVLGHVTNICITLYLHRSATHEGVRFHPVVEHAMRFWVWLTTAALTVEWVAVHRKHHAFADREGDPHSPKVEGFWAIVLGGVFFYRKTIKKDPDLLTKYGHGCPEDWIERNLYARFRVLGVVAMLALDIYLFGIVIGPLVWSAMAIWMPIMGNIINGIGHALGYRNFGTRDHSHNIYPWGIWILGEELHNNHHADPRSAKFKAHWWEFDIGWVYIKILSWLRLAKVLYARTASAKEFATRHYTDKVARPVAEAKARVDQAATEARAKVDHAATEARAKIDQAKAKVDTARTEARVKIDNAKTKLDQAKDEAKASLHTPKPTNE